MKIILAHLGGSTPFLAARVAVLSRHMGCRLTEKEILDDFKSFYYDTALSVCDSNLALVEAMAGYDHILFGSDLPGQQFKCVYSR
jgi:predicted TIM-barrel fold metal-dependent hydrolase